MTVCMHCICNRATQTELRPTQSNWEAVMSWSLRIQIFIFIGTRLGSQTLQLHNQWQQYVLIHWTRMKERVIFLHTAYNTSYQTGRATLQIPMLVFYLALQSVNFMFQLDGNLLWSLLPTFSCTTNAISLP